ncbi:hypothetical protein CBER1_08761 [Cercospora berteroae]|uniref:DUF7707 domain-containing protein n=1 Tax=Cercospora berteroae TaxID=357750 RepID=A0A2S6BW10_9PEZI|nr:hypothetical protein CBER1_08761 [Cercospora berteroae]
MFRTTLAVAFAALSAVASAQNYSTSGNLSITASEVPSTLRASWCRGQTIACPQICGGRAETNTCDAEQLTYDCSCPDGEARNISDYTQTLPFFVCEQWRTNCVLNHPDDRDGQAACESVTCGAQNATEAEGGDSSSASTSATPTSTSTDTAETGASETTGTDSSATPSASDSAAMHLAQNYGTGILVTGLLAVFGLAM